MKSGPSDTSLLYESDLGTNMPISNARTACVSGLDARSSFAAMRTRARQNRSYPPKTNVWDRANRRIARRPSTSLWTWAPLFALMLCSTGCLSNRRQVWETKSVPEAEQEIVSDSSADSLPVSVLDKRGLGESVQGRSLEFAVFGTAATNGDPQGNTTLILAGVHGDEPQSVYVARALMRLFAEHPEVFSDDRNELAGARVVIMPVVNPDGLVTHVRRNAHYVDLNRNFPSENWVPSRTRTRYYGGPEPASEPETQAVIRLVEEFQPDKIVALHCISHGSECNNYDGPAEELAETMSRLNNYPLEPHMGYATPGSLGTWAGIERKIPTITLECPARRSAEHCWQTNRSALLSAIAFRSNGRAD